ncbi:MAG: protein-tyrosine phosphatase family protein [Promethearchaeota archaeon]
MAGQSMCKIVDCRDLPEIDAENPSWDFGFYSTVKAKFDQKVEHVVNLIQSTKCPIFVHCAAGINRSVAVLAAALSLLTNKSIDTILADMKESRMIVAPQDPYYLMALETSPSEAPEVAERRFLELDQDFPLMQPGLPVTQAPSNRTIANSNWLVRCKVKTS